MRTVEERAQDFVSNGEYSPSLKECYIAGAAEEHLLLTHCNNEGCSAFCKLSKQ